MIDRFRNSARKDITRVKELLSSTFNRRNDGGKYPVETEISFLPYRVYRESNGTSEFTRWNGIISGQQIKIGTVEISLIGSRSTLHVPCIDTGVASKFFFSFFFSLSTRCWNRVRTRERIFVGREIHPFGPTAKWFSPRGGGSRVNCTIANCPLHHFSSPSLPPPPPYFSKSLDVSANSGRVLFFFSLPSNFNSELFFFFFFWREKELHDIYIFKFLFFKKL